MITDAIGGYFSLPLPGGTMPDHIASAVEFVSARAAIAAFLRTRPLARIWIPHFICEAAIEGIADTGFEVRRYNLAEDFSAPLDLPLSEKDTLLVVDYFGLSGASIGRAIAHFGEERVLVDASQSLFFAGSPAFNVVYSPRKFVAIPDGGLYSGPAPVKTTGEADVSASVRRSAHLLWRAAGHREAGRRRFTEAEASLRYESASPMSDLTRTMLRSIDFPAVASVRRRNVARLADSGRTEHPLLAYASRDAVPMCYPILTGHSESLRSALASENIFLAHYWPEVRLPEADRFARILLERTLFLPCDQRYDEGDMDRILHQLTRAETNR